MIDPEGRERWAFAKGYWFGFFSCLVIVAVVAIIVTGSGES